MNEPKSIFSEFAGMLGKIRTPKKAAASRKNGKLGGRPTNKERNRKRNKGNGHPKKVNLIFGPDLRLIISLDAGIGLAESIALAMGALDGKAYREKPITFHGK